MTQEEVKKASVLLKQLSDCRESQEKLGTTDNIKIITDTGKVVGRIPVTQHVVTLFTVIEEDIIEKLRELGVDVEDEA